jgi:hypothetical protein
MSRVLVALIVGAAIGGAVFLFLRREPSALAVTTVTAPAQPGSAGFAPTSRAYVSPAQPGLVVLVTRAGAPEPGAKVEIAESSRSPTTAEITWQPTGEWTTDAQGRAEFPATAGRYFVVATARDGTRAVESVDVSAARAMTLVTLVLKAPAVFSGSVVEAGSHRPIARAAVHAEPQQDPEENEPTVPVAGAVTDSLGRFGLELPERAWRLEAQAPGYLTANIAAPKPANDLVIELTRGVQLSGLVVDAAERPIADAAVHLTPGDVTSLSTDAEGRFTVVAPHSAVSLHAVATDGRQGLARVTLTDKQEHAQVVIVVGDGSALEGIVRDAQGPVAQADVRIFAEPESLEVASLVTLLDGRFAAKALPPGRYSVQAQQGLGRRASQVGVELPGAPQVELMLSAAGRLIGVVQDESGQPIEYAVVSAEWQRSLNEVRRTARTGPDGRFEFADLLPAEITIKAHVDELESEEIATYVAPGVTAEAILTIAPQGRLVGTVMDPKVRKVMVRREAGAGFIDAELKGTHFEKMLAPGTYRLFAETGTPKDHDIKFVESTTAVIRAGEITTVTMGLLLEDGGSVPTALDMRMHQELGSGLSFENSPGGVRVDFLMADCPAAKAGVRIGDLVMAIDGQPTRDALDAFARVRKSTDQGQTLDFTVRRDGQDLQLTLR